MEKLSFYDVLPEYVEYLRNFETNVRGFSHVPHINYQEQNRREKFFCGIVLQVNDMPYYVPVSSKTNNHLHSYYIYDGNQRIASLRFDYMFPVPRPLTKIKHIENEKSFNYKSLLRKELDFCRNNEATIRAYALRAYVEVLAPVPEGQPDRRHLSCNFRVLEGACEQYCCERGLSLDPQSPAADTRSLADLCADAKAKAAEANARQTAPQRSAPEHSRE